MVLALVPSAFMGGRRRTIFAFVARDVHDTRAVVRLFSFLNRPSLSWKALANCISVIVSLYSSVGGSYLVSVIVDVPASTQ